MRERKAPVERRPVRRDGSPRGLAPRDAARSHGSGTRACLDEEAVLAFVEGEADVSTQRATEAHLDRCEGCRRLVSHVADAMLATAGADRLPSLVPPALRLVEGQRIGRYVVEERLGAGGMGVVFGARHVDRGHRVALKVARTDDATIRARLLREARAASALRHPHVVAVHEVFRLDGGAPVIVMDRLEGETLAARIARGPLPWNEVARILDAILDALTTAHAQGVVHRDLKPDNVFLHEDDAGARVVLLDFGVAKLTSTATEASADLTGQGLLLGTPRYMAPEQAFGDPVDARADLWAVGVIAYECLTGRVPFDAGHVARVLQQLATLEHERLDALRPELPAALVAWIEGLLVPTERRPTDAAALRMALRAIRTPARSAPYRFTTGARSGWRPRPLRLATCTGGSAVGPP